MVKSLVIVESPAKSKTINKILGKDFVVKASMGHIRDLPKSKMGVDIEHDFEPQYITIKGKTKLIKELKAAAKGVDNIYLAPDPDREGEAIAWHISSYFENFKGNVYRVAFNEITKKAVLEAFDKAGTINMSLVNSQQARRILDRVVGYELSPLLWRSIGRGLSAGRVQSVTVRLVCEREEEIKKFVPEEYWSLDVLLEKLDTHQNVKASLEKKDGEKIEIKDKDTADNVMKDLQNAAFVISKITKKEQRKNPQPPFKTSLLQQQAAYKLGYAAYKTMGIAQQLYEGIDIGEGEVVGLITYMRTDSFRVSDDAQKETKDFILQKYGQDYVPEKPRIYKSKAGAQDAHEAIRPTAIYREPESIKQYLSPDQFKLYKLIWDRFVASQMASAIIDITSVEIKAENYMFKLLGSQIRFDGYLRSQKDDDKIDDETESEDLATILPPLTEGEELKRNEFLPAQHFTKPPARYSEATLVKALEENGIGRPSTYAPTIKTIQDREYVRKFENRFYPTELGVKVNELLVKFFSKIVDIQFTANMESILDEIEEGKKDWVGVLKDFYGDFHKHILEMSEKIKDIRKEVITTEEKCEVCGAFMVLKIGRFGRFLACSKYPECKTTKKIPRQGEKKIELDEQEIAGLKETCEKCGSEMLIKKGRFGPFWACSKYPDCKTTKPLSIKTGDKCPEEGCDGEMLKRWSKRGQVFYGCSNYPKCKHVSGSR